MMNWNEHYAEMVAVVAKKSRDPSTKVGCVIVGPHHEVRSTGYNGLARGVGYTPARYITRPSKYLWMEHAERNAIYNAARNGVSLEECICFISGPPCADCARGIIQVGITQVIVCNMDLFSDRLTETIDVGQDMLRGAKVEYFELNTSAYLTRLL